MELYIDTSKFDSIRTQLKEKGKTLCEITKDANRAQAEELLPAIERCLKESGRELQGIEKVIVTNEGESFTALRIGIATANALAYALGIKAADQNGNFIDHGNFSLAAPHYDREPNISKEKIKI